MRLSKTHYFTAALICATSASAQQFRSSSTLMAPSYPSIGGNGNVTMASGDLDGDGDQDIVMGIDSTSPSGSTLRLIRNGITNPATGFHEAYGAFVDQSSALVTSDRIFDVDIFDADGDGDNDVVYVTSTVSGASTFSQVALMRQISPGVFTSPVGIFGTSGSIPVTAEIADISGDGRMDIVLGTASPSGQSGQGPILLIQTAAGFQTTVLASAFPGMTSTSIAIGDIEGDGDLDIIAGNRSAQGSSLQNVLYRNNAGAFAPAPLSSLPLGAINTEDVLLVDLHGSSLPEYVIVDAFGIVRVFTNSGGIFGGVAQAFNGASAGGQADSADVDLDGDLDLAVAFPGANSNPMLLLNNGATMSSAPTRITADGPATSVTFTDVDRDGDPDITFGTPFVQSGSAYRVQVNLHRQIDAPRMAPLGSVYTFDYYDRPGYGSPVTPTAFLTTGNLVPRFLLAPFGEFGVDPTTTVVNSPIAQVNSGMMSLTLTLPGTGQGLNSGDTWFWQLLHVPVGGLPTDGRLTNVLPLTFL